jgi:hypothetical protein
MRLHSEGNSEVAPPAYRALWRNGSQNKYEIRKMAEGSLSEGAPRNKNAVELQKLLPEERYRYCRSLVELDSRR